MNDKLEQEYLEYDRQGRIWGNVPRERISKIKFPRISKHIIDQYLLLDDLTSTISDVLDLPGPERRGSCFISLTFDARTKAGGHGCHHSQYSSTNHPDSRAS